MRILASPPLLSCALLVLALACASAGDRRSPGTEEVGEDVAPADRVEAIADAYVRGYFERHPERATIDGVEGADHGRLTDRSLEAIAAWRKREDAWLADLREIDPDGLPRRAALAYDFLRERLEASVDRRTCRHPLWAVSPTYTGWQARFALLVRVQPVGDERLRKAALRRFGSLPGYLDTEIANLREGIRLGYTAPRGNVEAVIEQMDALLAAEPLESPFYALARRARAPDFDRRVLTMIEESIRPAIARYRDFLRNEYLPSAREEIAVEANPDGEACYRASVRYYTSIAVPPEEIHATGLEEMERIEEEMREIAERSFGTTDLPTLLERLRTDPRYTFDSRREMIEVARSAVDRARGAVAGWFGLVPEADVEIQPYPPFQERSAPGGQYTPAPDDRSRPAVYLINTYRAEEQSRAGLESTAFHETYPGHHLQIAIAKEHGTGHPISRYFRFSGFSEGWALYSERLAREMGLFSGDIDRMGLLSNEALRAARLVVDSGMHALGWSRERAIEYLLTHTAESRSSAVSEIDRYIAVPGQATSYMLGRNEILRLRERARSRLGAAFDIEEFHDRLLEDGGVTLGWLRRKIERWIEEETG